MHFITNLSSISSLTVRSMKAQAGGRIFPGHALMFVPVTAGNPKHRPYPRSLENENTRWRDDIETVRQEAPLIYRNRTLFKDFLWESPSVITVLLCKLVLPSTGDVSPVCPCRCLRVRLSLRVHLLTSPSLCPPSTRHLPILLLMNHLSLIHYPQP